MFCVIHAAFSVDGASSADIEAIRRVYPSTEFTWLEKTLRLGWKDAIALLRENNVEVDDFEDFKYVLLLQHTQILTSTRL